MKFAPTAVVLAFAVAGGAALPIDDMRRAWSDKTTAPRFHHQHGDYPGPAFGERFASLAQALHFARIAPDTFRRHEAAI
jgi:hypothetical protein